MTLVELVCGLLKGCAVVDAANEGVPYRMWTRIQESEILDRLAESSYEEVAQVADALEESFAEAGIALTETDPRHTPETWMLARRLLRFVFLDPMDSMIYASAAVAVADQLVSFDGYLRRVANALQNPPGANEKQDQFQNAKDGITELPTRRQAASLRGYRFLASS